MVAATERERKFLVADRSFLRGHTPTRLCQAYLIAETDFEVRIRQIGVHYVLGIKVGGAALARQEEELVVDSREIADACFARADRTLIKDRYAVTVNDASLWEIDVFYGDNEGLVIAEIEILDAKTHITLPAWCGKEVTGIKAFYNASLSQRPINTWPEWELSRHGLRPNLGPL